MHQLTAESVKSNTNMFDWRFYVQWAPAVLILPIVAVVIRQHIRLNHISKLVIMMSSLHRTQAFELRRLATTTAMEVDEEGLSVTQDYSLWLVQQLLRDISVTEAIFFAIIIGLIISIGIALISLWHYAMGRHSYIYIEALSPTDCLQLRICKLPNATRTFSLTHGRITIKIQHLGCIAIAHITANLQLTNTLTQKPIKAPKVLFLTPAKHRE